MTESARATTADTSLEDMLSWLRGVLDAQDANADDWGETSLGARQM